jgi:hypothetical protein
LASSFSWGEEWPGAHSSVEQARQRRRMPASQLAK